MSLTVRALTGAALEAALPDVARLRITVFRDWPYLYDGDLAYEEGYLQSYRDSEWAIVVGAFDGDRLVGAATGTPLADHADEFGAAFAGQGMALDRVFYCAESVLLPAHRGQGAGHRFFDLREAHARALGFDHVTFCAVQRPADHPARPETPQDLQPFWRKRGYAPLDGVTTTFGWKDIGATDETHKPMQFWMKAI